LGQFGIPTVIYAQIHPFFKRLHQISGIARLAFPELYLAGEAQRFLARRRLKQQGFQETRDPNIPKLSDWAGQGDPFCMPHAAPSNRARMRSISLRTCIEFAL